MTNHICTPIKLFSPTSDGLTGFFIPNYQAEKEFACIESQDHYSTLLHSGLMMWKSIDIWSRRKSPPHASDLISMPFCCAIISILRENEAFIIRKNSFPQKNMPRNNLKLDPQYKIIRGCCVYAQKSCGAVLLQCRGKEKNMLGFPPFFLYPEK